jgi:hypothetical protein
MSIINLTKSLKNFKKSAQKKNTTIKNKYPSPSKITTQRRPIETHHHPIHNSKLITALYVKILNDKKVW